MVMSHEIFELLLCFGDFAFENVCLLFFGIVDFIDLVKFLFRFNSESLCDIVIVMCFLVIHLVGSKLLLRSVKTDTDFLFAFLNCFSFLFWLIAIPIRVLLLFQGAAY